MPTLWLYLLTSLTSANSSLSLVLSNRWTSFLPGPRSIRSGPFRYCLSRPRRADSTKSQRLADPAFPWRKLQVGQENRPVLTKQYNSCYFTVPTADATSWIWCPSVRSSYILFVHPSSLPLNFVRRYVFLIFNQTPAFDSQTLITPNTSVAMFNISSFAAATGLGQPIGGTFMFVAPQAAATARPSTNAARSKYSNGNLVSFVSDFKKTEPSSVFRKWRKSRAWVERNQINNITRYVAVWSIHYTYMYTDPGETRNEDSRYTSRSTSLFHPDL